MVGTTTVLLLPNGRRVHHPEPVERGHVLELSGTFYYVEAAVTGLERATGAPVVLAQLSEVRR